MSEQLKLIIVDDHEIFRTGLKMIMGKLKNVKVVAEAANGKEFLDIIDYVHADIVLMDIEMPIMNGIDATKLALSKFPDLKVIALSMFNNDAYVQSMLDVGARGYLLKNITKDILDKAITTIAKGNSYYSEELWNFFTRRLANDNKQSEPVIRLTRREKEILQLMATGLNNKEISNRLFVSERTIIGHKSNLMAKTGCKSTISLLSYAIKNKLVIM